MSNCDPLRTCARTNPDFNAADLDNEIAMLINRQAMIENVLSGRESPQALLDLVEHQGINPEQYQEFVIDNALYLGLL